MTSTTQRLERRHVEFCGVLERIIYKRKGVVVAAVKHSFDGIPTTVKGKFTIDAGIEYRFSGEVSRKSPVVMIR